MPSRDNSAADGLDAAANGAEADDGPEADFSSGNKDACVLEVCNSKKKYRVTQHVGSNLLLTSKQKFRFGLARSGQARPGQANTELLF